MIIRPLNEINILRNAIFLAGPSPIGNEKDCRWREEVIKLFEQKGFNGDIINPVNDHFDDTDLQTQIAWEVEGMMKSSLIFFWIPRNDKHPSFTTNVEFGNAEHIAPQKLFKPGKCKKCKTTFKWTIDTALGVTAR